MELHGKSRQYGSDTFSNTASLVFRLITIGFILFNFIMMLNPVSANKFYTMLLTAVSLSQIIFICAAEPITYKKYPQLNFVINILIAACFGILLYLSKTNISQAAFFTNMVVAGLRLSITKSILLSIIYYMTYLLSVFYSPQAVADLVMFDIHILIILILTVYLCHYFSSIENKKIKQDDAIVELMEEKAVLIHSLGSKSTELNETYWDMVETLIGIIEARDNLTGGHSVKVCDYSVKLSKKLELSESEISNIMKAAILHDIGKMGIPDDILLKPGALSTDEYDTIMNHPEIGCRILSKIKGLEDVLPMVLYHHERVDGTGYPYGIENDRIPIGAKIIAIADAYDAMTSNRPYRKALIKKEAKKRLLEGSGTQFDPELVKKFLAIIDEDNVDDIRDYRYIEHIKKKLI